MILLIIDYATGLCTATTWNETMITNKYTGVFEQKHEQKNFVFTLSAIMPSFSVHNMVAVTLYNILQ